MYAVFPDVSYGCMLYYLGAGYLPMMQNGQLWRYVTYAFLHADEIHLITNLIGVIIYGWLLESIALKSSWRAL